MAMGDAFTMAAQENARISMGNHAGDRNSTIGSTGMGGGSSGGGSKNGEYVAVIPVTDMGLGLFLKDENGEVVIGGFRAPRNGTGINPSQRAGKREGKNCVWCLYISSTRGVVSSLGRGALDYGSDLVERYYYYYVSPGVRVGDVLVRVHGTRVNSVAETIAALRKSRLEQVSCRVCCSSST